MLLNVIIGYENCEGYGSKLSTVYSPCVRGKFPTLVVLWLYSFLNNHQRIFTKNNIDVLIISELF